MVSILSMTLTGVALGLPAGLLPGPLNALVLRQTLQHGRREGLWVAMTPLLTDTPIAILAYVLSSHWFNATALASLSIAGAGVCGVLGWETFRSPPPSSSDRPAGTLRRSVIVNVSNPHAWVFWVTIGAPTMGRTTSWGALAFALGFVLTLVLTKGLLVTLTYRRRDLLTGAAWRWVRSVLALFLGGFGLWMLLDGLQALDAALRAS